MILRTQVSFKTHLELVLSAVLLSIGVGLSAVKTIELIMQWMGL